MAEAATASTPPAKLPSQVVVETVKQDVEMTPATEPAKRAAALASRRNYFKKNPNNFFFKSQNRYNRKNLDDFKFLEVH